MPAKPVPAGVGAAAKQGLLELVDYAAGRGWPASKTCEVLGLSERRHRRFRRRQDSGKKLDDGRPGASPGALMPCETCGGSWVPSRPSPTSLEGPVERSLKPDDIGTRSPPHQREEPPRNVESLGPSIPRNVVRSELEKVVSGVSRFPMVCYISHHPWLRSHLHEPHPTFTR